MLEISLRDRVINEEISNKLRSSQIKRSTRKSQKRCRNINSEPSRKKIYAESTKYTNMGSGGSFNRREPKTSPAQGPQKIPSLLWA